MLEIIHQNQLAIKSLRVYFRPSLATADGAGALENNNVNESIPSIQHIGLHRLLRTQCRFCIDWMKHQSVEKKENAVGMIVKCSTKQDTKQLLNKPATES